MKMNEDEDEDEDEEDEEEEEEEEEDDDEEEEEEEEDEGDVDDDDNDDEEGTLFELRVDGLLLLFDGITTDWVLPLLFFLLSSLFNFDEEISFLFLFTESLFFLLTGSLTVNVQPLRRKVPGGIVDARKNAPLPSAMTYTGSLSTDKVEA